MTRARTLMHQTRHVLWTLAVLQFVGGALAIVFLWVERDRTNERLEEEANLRGAAVSTLAGDVRALRAQVLAKGETPVAPDPSSAVEDLPDRAEVPVPIPGPAGPPGKDAPTITPSPGPTGPAGKDGADSTVPGPTGPPGADSTIPGPSGASGVDGRDGVDGEDGQPPAGWSFTYRGVEYSCGPVDGFDPGAPRYECVASEPEPDEPGGGGAPQSLALDPQRRQYA